MASSPLDPFVPVPDSDAVRRLCREIGLDVQAIRVRVSAEVGGDALLCFENVRRAIERDGGQMVLGWAIWQHGDLFVEGEWHAVHAPGEGRPWVDRTPRRVAGQRVRETLFVPVEGASYDFETTQVTDNVRVALVPDPRVARALDLLAEKAKLLNSVPGFGVVPAPIADRIHDVEVAYTRLLLDALAPPRPSTTAPKQDRNERCACGSGLKHKKCCGR
jgi:hypothetical protein